MKKFIVNNRTDALKADINLFFTITNCRIVRSCSLTHRINYKFMRLSAYWQYKLANERSRISAVIVKTLIDNDVLSQWSKCRGLVRCSWVIPQHSMPKKFFSELELKKALKKMQAALSGLLLFDIGKLANQIVRLVASVIKYLTEEWYSNLY